MTSTLTDRLIAAIEGECDGLAITGEQASNILAYLQYGAAMGDFDNAYRIIDHAIGRTEDDEQAVPGGDLRIVTLRLDMAKTVRAALLAPTQQPSGEVTDSARERRHWKPEYNTDPVQRACAELPEGWGVNACMERDAGWVEVYGPDGEEPNFESDADHFDWQIHEAIDFAITAASAMLAPLPDPAQVAAESPDWIKNALPPEGA